MWTWQFEEAGFETRVALAVHPRIAELSVAHTGFKL